MMYKKNSDSLTSKHNCPEQQIYSGKRNKARLIATVKYFSVFRIFEVKVLMSFKITDICYI